MLGTGPFAVPTLQTLAKRHQLLAVIARPPQGRQPVASPMQQAAMSLGLEVWLPDSVNVSESQTRLASLGPDLLVVCDYGEILKPETLATARLGGINLHASLLPKFRGAAPVQWAILRGEQETGNSVIQMTAGLDAGPCLGQQRTPIDPEETAGELEARLAVMGAELVCRVVEELEAGRVQSIEQDAALASKARRLKKEDGNIDWSHPAQEIKNRVRALRPWPRAFTNWHRAEGGPIRLNIDRVAVVASESKSLPGTVIEADMRLIVASGEKAIELLELQPAGKRSMSAADFLRGNRVTVGDRLGPISDGSAM